MPKKPRQSHIPQQPKRRRQQRRPEPVVATGTARPPAPPPAGAGPEAVAAAVATAPERPRGRRVEQMRAPLEQQLTSVRVVPGQLPTFDRAYLVRELRQISAISATLMGVIVVLAFVLR